MPSFFEPNQGENGLDQIVNFQLQERRQKAAEERYAQREADQQNQANVKANSFNLNKAFDPTKYDIDAIHAQNLNDILAKGKQAGIDYQAKNKKQDQYEFQNVISPYVDQANKYLNSVNAVNKKITDISGVYKGDKFRNQTAYQNAIYKKAHYDDKGNLLAPEQVDVDAAHAYVDAHPEMFIQDPVSTIQKAYLDSAKGQVETHTDTNIDKRDGSAHTSTVKYMSTPYTGAPVVDANGNYTLPIQSEPFMDADHKPIAGRKILAAQAFADMKSNSAAAQSIQMLTRKAHPDYDPDTNEGAQLEAETAYNFLKQHARLGVSDVQKTVQGDPMKQQLEAARLQKMASDNALTLFNLQMKKEKEASGGKAAKLDDYVTNVSHVLGNDPNVGVPQTYNVFGKDYDVKEIGSTFPDGKLAIGIDKKPMVKGKDGMKQNPGYNKPIYADGVYKMQNGGVIVKTPDGKTQIYETPKKAATFFSSVASMNKSSVVDANNVINGDAPEPKKSIVQKLKEKILPKKKDPLGIL